MVAKFRPSLEEMQIDFELYPIKVRIMKGFNNEKINYYWCKIYLYIVLLVSDIDRIREQTDMACKSKVETTAPLYYYHYYYYTKIRV